MFSMAKRSFKREEDKKEENEESEMDTGDYDDDEGEVEEVVNEDRKKKIVIKVVYGQGLRTTSAISCSSSLCCQADECGVDLRMAKKYHQRHKVCERHSKAPVVLVRGIRQRFCQQCSKFHEIAQFDGTKRSCRERLAGHNERRRKTHADLRSGTAQQPESSQMNSSSLNATRLSSFGVTNLFSTKDLLI